MTTIQQILNVINRETGKEGITFASKIEDLGFDSLEFVSLLLEIEKELGRSPHDDKVAEIETVADIAEAFA